MTREEQIYGESFDRYMQYTVGIGSNGNVGISDPDTGNFSVNDLRQAFEDGAEWADEHLKSPWISTKERLPMVVSYNYTEGDNAVHDSEIEDTCLCHFKGGMGLYSSEYFIAHLESEYVDNSRESLYWADDPGNIICWVDEVDYYMPLPNYRKEVSNEQTEDMAHQCRIKGLSRVFYCLSL